MSCPHAKNSTPETCSQCIGSATRKVTLDGSIISVDGVVVERSNDHQSTSYGRRVPRRQRRAKIAP